jgi:hypothetical protein
LDGLPSTRRGCFPALWKLATPFIDAKKHDKIIFTKTLDELCKYVDRSTLPPRLAGRPTTPQPPHQAPASAAPATYLGGRAY